MEAVLEPPSIVRVRAIDRRSLGVAAICVVATCFQLWPVLWLVLSASALALAILKRTHTARPISLLDMGIVAFYLSSCLSTLLAYDTATALPQLFSRSCFLLIYLACRSANVQLPAVLFGAGVGTISHCIGSISTFSHSYGVWQHLHFTSLVAFRSLVALTPYGVNPGNHAAIYIVAIAIGGYQVLGRNHSVLDKTVFMALIVLSGICVLLSFSRALYLSAFLCACPIPWILLQQRRINRKTAAIGASVLLLSGFITTVTCHEIAHAVVKTLSVSSELSQRRSTQGRMTILRTALSLLPHGGLYGAGLGNYALEERRLGLTPATPTAHPLNQFMEITVEQGLIGVAALGIIFAGCWRRVKVLWSSSSRNRSLIGGCIALALFAMCQTFVIADQFTATLLAVFIATFSRTGEPCSE